MNNEYSSTWSKMRSDIYIRDKGICWVCNEFVPLDNYDLGHLIDRCKGGYDAYVNLTVMHKSCNLSKPRHNTLEDALRWRLLLRIPNISHNDKFPILYRTHKVHKYSQAKIARIQAISKIKNDALNARIVPNTICWIQGYPKGGAMWRVIVPPYRKEDAFIMRQTPQGAILNENQYGVEDTFQIINGQLDKELYIDIGFYTVHLKPNKGKIDISLLSNAKSNAGKITIGQGKNQIPVNDWMLAKVQGINISDFKRDYARYPHDTASITSRT
jgi:hypothetical protein